MILLVFLIGWLALGLAIAALILTRLTFRDLAALREAVLRDFEKVQGDFALLERRVRKLEPVAGDGAHRMFEESVQRALEKEVR